MIFFFFNDTATTEIYTLSLHDALPICFEATQALGMAVRQQFGHLGAGAARGVALRHDHGSNFMADHFHKQVRFWGMSPSYAFVREPETNGVKIGRASCRERV